MITLIFALSIHPALAGCVAELAFPFTDPRPSLQDRHLLGTGRYSRTWLRRVGAAYFADKEFGPGDQDEVDLAAFVAHAWLTQGQPIGIDLPPKVIRGVPGRSPRIIMPGYRIAYYPGQTVQDLVLDKQHVVRPDVRRRVQEAYIEAFARFKALAEAQLGPQRATYWNYQHRLPWLHLKVHRARLGHLESEIDEVEFTIKPDNIIVDPWTLRMTMVDPF